MNALEIVRKDIEYNIDENTKVEFCKGAVRPDIYVLLPNILSKYILINRKFLFWKWKKEKLASRVIFYGDITEDTLKLFIDDMINGREVIVNYALSGGSPIYFGETKLKDIK